MKWLYAISGILGLAVGALGCLWFLQGVGLVVIEPIACVGECEALTGPSLGWAIAGLAMLLVGAALIWWSIRRFMRT
jgi:hypothetical protein